MPLTRVLLLTLLAAGCSRPARPGPTALSAERDPLPSWANGPTKARIVAFVEASRTEGDPGFVPQPERIAVFDNDGTLWSEQPLYFEVLFALDRVRALAPEHPEWRTRQPFKAVLDGDMQAVASSGHRGLEAIMAASHSGLTTDAFDSVAHRWIATARHPVTRRPFTDMVYQPQLELLRYLREAGYATWIVSGGTANFLRAWTDSVYGIPRGQVVGSRLGLAYRHRGGAPAVFVEPTLDLLDDGPGKPIGIAQQIGRRPVIAVGNSDGDYEMLDYTTSGPGPRLGIYIHHDDSAREYAYDRASKIGTLRRGLDSAAARGWLVTSMKDDWRTIHPPQP
jgi:phosphoglycolate phosphatase-like HAD superfamily hydrolase